MRPTARALIAAALVALAVVPVSGASAVAPPVPPACQATTVTVSNTTVVAIPTTGTVSSQLTVTGVESIADIDVFTNITHTRSADIDMTLASPGGSRVVTLTTDNGGANDNVFAGTTWDDDADPGGQVPYTATAKKRLVEDHTYVDNVVATPLAPEEPLGAFIGTSNPNGAWTLTIHDDELEASPQGGTLNSWSMIITSYLTAPAVDATEPLSGPGFAIDSLGTDSSEIEVSGLPTYLLRAAPTTDIQHDQNRDIEMTLKSPQGTVVTLTTDHGLGIDNFSPTNWLDSMDKEGGQVPYTTNPFLATDHVYENGVNASLLAPEEATSAFIGENPNGTWTLTIHDDAGGDEGTLDSWKLALGVPENPAVVCPAPPCDGQTVTITGIPASETINGTDGADVIDGLGGADIINGLGGDDVICGSGGKDTISGGTGNDVLIGGAGADIIKGGNGRDTVAYAERTSSVNVTLDDVANDGGTGEADNVKANVEDVTGGSGNDKLTGSSIGNNLAGGLGSDTLTGKGGDDVLNGEGGQDSATGGGGSDTCFAETTLTCEF